MNPDDTSMPASDPASASTTGSPKLKPAQWAEVKSILALGLELPRSRRLSWFAALRIEDREVQEEVRRLILQEPGMTGTTEVMPSPPDARPLTFQSGQRVADRFEITAFLGAGGMGEVYAAKDLKIPGEAVALKTLRREYAGQSLYVSRMQREVQLARKLRHPNLCHVHDIHSIPIADGVETWAFSMELLHGEPLSHHIRNGLWPLPEVLDILRQIAAGLQAVHDGEILHRDLKSGNVLILEAPSLPRRAVITDFGLAHQLVRNDETHSLLLGTNAIVGTTPYMAPEQLRGEGASKLSDIYSLGVIAFQLVTGRLPFEGETALAVALRRLKQEAPSPRSFHPGLPYRWDVTIRACLSADPRGRPPSASRFMELLEGSKSAGIYWARRMSRRALVGSLATAAAGATYLLWKSNRPRFHPPEAVASFKRGTALIQQRDQSSIQNALGEFGRAVKIDPAYAEAWASLANAYCVAAHYVSMNPKQARIEAAKAANKALQLDNNLAQAQAALAYSESVDLNRWRSAEPAFAKAIQLGPQDALPHTWFAAFLGRAGRFDEAILQAKAGADIEPGDFPICNQLAYEYYRARKYPAFYRVSKDQAGLHANVAGAHLNVARACEWLGRFDEALKECEEAQKYSDAASTLSFRGTLEAAMGHPRAANQIAEKVVAYWKERFLEVNVVVSLLGKLGRTDDVLDALGRAYDEGDGTVLACATNPYLEKMLDIPRYRTFLAKLGFDAKDLNRFKAARS